MAFGFFEQLLIILAVSLGAVVLFARLGLPSILAYMLAGALIGPDVLSWVNEPEQFTLIAEFGVVFLLFSLGLEFSLARMMHLRGPVFGLGGAQVGITTLAFAVAVFTWGATIEAAIVIAGALALSSTAIVTRELGTLQRYDTRYAQLSIAILLFQDLVAVVFLILVPVFAGDGDTSMAARIGWALLKGGALLLFLMAVGKWVLPRLYHEVARARSDEVFLLTTLVIALLAAWLTHAFQLSMALGGFVIGMMLGEGPFKHQIDNEIRPFKDVLLGLFFVTIGMAVDLDVVAEHWQRIAVFTLALIAINIAIVTTLVRIMGEHTGAALRTGITLAQAGEFGLALLVVAILHGVVPLDQGSFIIAIAVLSMMISPFLIREADYLAERVLAWMPSPGQPEPLPQAPGAELDGHVIVGGFGRVGQTIAQLLEDNHFDFIGIDGNAEIVRSMNRDGREVIFGDCTNIAMLTRCRIEHARVAILTFRDAQSAKQTIQTIRGRGIQTPIVVRCYDNVDFEEMISLGADHVIPEVLETSLVLGTHVLGLLDLDAQEINRQVSRLRDPGSVA